MSAWRPLPQLSSTPAVRLTASMTSSISETELPVTFFDNIFGGCYDVIVYSTNLYTTQTRIKTFTDTTDTEIKAFTGMLVHMSIHDPENCRAHWSRDPDPAITCVNRVMPRTHFFQVRGYILTVSCSYILHLMIKVGLYHGDMTLWKSFNRSSRICRLSFKRSMNPRVAFYWRKHGSLQRTQVIQTVHADEANQKRVEGVRKSRCNHSVCLSIWGIYGQAENNWEPRGACCENLLHKPQQGMSGCVWQFFTSFQLMQDLYSVGINAAGTVRQQRTGLPDTLKNKKKWAVAATRTRWRKMLLLFSGRIRS